MRASSADIRDELAVIAREAGFLAETLAGAAAGVPAPGSHAEWELTHVCAAAVERIYSGCERVMARIAAAEDGDAVRHAEGWHVALLRRMATPFPGHRGPVISPGTERRLDRLRAFRHRVRNSYGIQLDAGIVRDRAGEALEAFVDF